MEEAPENSKEASHYPCQTNEWFWSGR